MGKFGMKKANKQERMTTSLGSTTDTIIIQVNTNNNANPIRKVIIPTIIWGRFQRASQAPNQLAEVMNIVTTLDAKENLNCI